MKAKIVILLMALLTFGRVPAQTPTDSTSTVLVQDSAYIASQTAEIERLLAEVRMQQVLDSLAAAYALTPRFKAKDALVPAAVLAVSAVAVWEHNLCKAKQHVYEHLEASHTNADDYLQWAPLAMGIGMHIGGLRSRYSPFDDMLATLNSVALMYGVGAAMKYSIREPRPYNANNRTSFPSGHVARAFRSAEMLRLQYGNWWGLGGYAVATTVGYLRLRNGKHWFNDVLGGAAFGILCARAGYWLVPIEKKLFGCENRTQVIIGAVPYYDPSSRSVGAAMAMRF
ncbi:MAG: phosphatase PAP2 family protein [Muribaculaceae bacterium]